MTFRCATLATRIASTAGLGTRAFFGSTRSFHTHANPLNLSLIGTENAKSVSDSRTAGCASAMRRMSACVAMRVDDERGFIAELTRSGWQDRDDESTLRPRGGSRLISRWTLRFVGVARFRGEENGEFG